MTNPNQPTNAQEEYWGRVLDAYSTYDQEGAKIFQNGWDECKAGTAEPFIMEPDIQYRWMTDALLEESLEHYEVPKDIIDEFHKVFPRPTGTKHYD